MPFGALWGVSNLVGIVLVSHSHELARGLADLASQVAGDGVKVEPAGGGPGGSLGTSGDAVREAIARADSGEGAVAAAVMSSAGQSLEDVVKAAEDARGASKF